MRNLSKSKIIAYRQCPKRLWLEIHRPELRDDSGSEAVFQIGYEVGEIAQEIYDVDGNGTLIDIEGLGFKEAFVQSEKLLLQGNGPIFEAGLKANGALAFADVMLPDHTEGFLSWNMIEVKSSSSVKDYHHDDIAVQSYVAESAGVMLNSVSLAHINNEFVYPGEGDYRGLLREVDLTKEAKSRRDEVAEWVAGAQEVAACETEPDISVGPHCSQPFACPFWDHCHPEEDPVEYPLSSLPRLNAGRREAIEALGISDIRDIPDGYLTDNQSWIRDQTRSGETYFDAEGAAADLAGFGFPVRFLDFETAMLAIPIWKGTRPYQQLPFQFSLHHLDESGDLSHEAFLDLSGSDPRLPLASSVIQHCGESGPIFAYNAKFEIRILRELAESFPEHESLLRHIIDRIVDLEPIARRRFYHPSQHGSWSLKAILPAACPDLSYGDLEGIADGGMAMEAFKEALAPETIAERKQEIESQLFEYCHLDTLALVRLWQLFAG